MPTRVRRGANTSVSTRGSQSLERRLRRSTQELQQQLGRLPRALLDKEVAAIEHLAAEVRGALAPDCFDVVGSADPSPAPDGQQQMPATEGGALHARTSSRRCRGPTHAASHALPPHHG
jgi:hypothetical protein